MRHGVWGAVAAVMALALATEAAAGPPTEHLRTSVDQVLKVLADAELRRDGRTLERRRLIRGIANDIFDFGEISRRSLAVHWQQRTPAERAEFVALFGDLLESAYIAKIEGYSGEKIVYAGDTVDGSLALVRTRILTRQGPEIPVDYRMFLRGEQWRAYDVNIEGVSLVANYRSQFNSIIQRAGYSDLVAKLRAKQEERPGARETARRPGTGGASATAAPGAPPRQAP
jgi:phospholipid transport system substrate-binding protein